MNRIVIAFALATAVGGATGCKKSTASSAGGTTSTSTGAVGAEASGKPIGVLDPTPKINGAVEKALSRGNKAMAAKKYGEAQDAYREVLAGAPDYLPARWLLVRALVLAGSFGDVPAQFEELVTRDYVGYAHKLDKGREGAALRASSEWAKIEALRAQSQAAFAAGLDRGFLFVDRLRPATGTELHQEAFHYSPTTRRFRRLTETGGHVFAVSRTPNGKSATALLVDASLGAAPVFENPRVVFIDLVTLEVHGPMALAGSVKAVTLGVNNFGEPQVEVIDGGNSKAEYVLDSAKAGLAAVGVPPVGASVYATPTEVSYSAQKSTDGVTLAEGAAMFTVSGVDKPITSSRPIAESSLDWSPGKVRITYAGTLDPCKAAERNELFVFDKAAKTAQRVAQAVSYFETLWLSDDQLVYETGVGKDGRIGIYDLPAHSPTILPTRFGAGLYGVPTLNCQAADDGEPDGVDVDEGGEGPG